MSTPNLYRGWAIAPVRATQVNYKLPDSKSALQRAGIGTLRHVSGWIATDPDGYCKFTTTKKAAIQYIDQYEGA